MTDPDRFPVLPLPSCTLAPGRGQIHGLPPVAGQCLEKGGGSATPEPSAQDRTPSSRTLDSPTSSPSWSEQCGLSRYDLTAGDDTDLWTGQGDNLGNSSMDLLLANSTIINPNGPRRS
ncbi:uncharacterized protein LOC128929697 [Callithrix jacchus]